MKTRWVLTLVALCVLAVAFVRAPSARAANALTVYPMYGHATTLPNADLLGANLVTSNTNWSGWIIYFPAHATGWCQAINSSFSCSPTGTLGNPTPTGQGWLLDSATLEGQQIVAGAWSGNENAAGGSSKIKFKVVERYYVYHSNGTYTAIGQSPESAQVTGAGLSNWTGVAIPSVSLGAVNFLAGDKLYVDVWLHATTNNSSSAIGAQVQTAGVANTFNPADYLITPGIAAVGKPAPSFVVRRNETMDSATCYTSFGGSCPSGGDNSWGTHTSRIVRDSAGYIFQADMLQNGTWAVRRRDTSGVWSTVLSAALNSSNSRPNNLLLDPSDHLHVYNWNGTAMTEYVSSNHGGSFTSSSVPGPWVLGNLGYTGAGIGNGGVIAITQTGNSMAPGVVYYAVYNPGTGTWATATHNSSGEGLDYRYSYLFNFITGSGALLQEGNRDVLQSSEAGCGSFSQYEFDTNKAFSIATATTPSGTLSSATIKSEPCVSINQQYFVVWTSDAYVDTNGLLHVLYYDRNSSPNLRHAILNGLTVTSDTAVPSADYLGDPYHTRITQDSAGRFYIISVNTGTGNIEFAPGTDTDTDGTSLGTPVTLMGLPADAENGDFSLTSPRSGVGLADYVDLSYGDSSHNERYFRISLNVNG